MTNGEKERFCILAAALVAPPDAALVDDLRQDGLYAQLEEYVRAWGGDRRLLSAFAGEPGRDDFLSDLQAAYLRLFVEPTGEKISLVESTYKAWTADRTCGMVFAAAKGLVMGDHALHMLDIYEQLSLEVPDEFRSIPDHLVLELEFLALLYQFAEKEQVESFIVDHLDWIEDLKGEMERPNLHPFYRNGVELIHLFLQNEIKNGKVQDHG